MRAQRLNTTQRSWSNYVGDKPIKRWKGKAPIGEARFYADSPLYGPGGAAVADYAPPPPPNVDPASRSGSVGDSRGKELSELEKFYAKRDRTQQESAIRRSMRQLTPTYTSPIFEGPIA
jgi:hypothetical protein